MIFTKKAKQRLVCLLTAASLSLPGFCITGLAQSQDVVCPKSLADSGAYELDDIGHTEGSAFTLDEFKVKLEAAEEDGRTAICTFEGLDIGSGIDTLNLQYGKENENGEKEKSLSVKHDVDSAYMRFKVAAGQSLIHGYASSGSTILYLDGGSEWTYTFSPAVNKDKLEVVKAVGFISTRRNLNMKITAHYANISDGETSGSETITVTKGSNAKAGSSDFVGFEAPENCFITKLVIIISPDPEKNVIYATGIDDLSLITQEVLSEEARPKRIEITAPDTVKTSYYGSILEYDCTAKVLDQFGRELDSAVEITVDNNDVAEIKDGKLIIKQQAVMPDAITLTASAGERIKTKTITVDTSVSPYYDVSRIGYDAYEVYAENSEKYYDEETEKVLSEQTDLTMGEFIAAMEKAAAADNDKQDVAMINFEGGEFANPEAPTAEELEKLFTVPLSKDREKIFTFTTVTRNPWTEWVNEANEIATEKNLASTPSKRKKILVPSGKMYKIVSPAVNQENDYLFDTSQTGDYRATHFGFVYVSKGTYKNYVSDGFGIQATFSDGTQKTYGINHEAGNDKVATKEKNTFYGIKAPAGHYITRIVITVEPRTYNGADNFGFIFEKPDVLTLKPDFENLTFSSFCDQNMENITEDIVLPTVTDGGCTINWTAKTPEGENYVVSDVIATDETDSANLGKIKVPDISEKSNVRLSAEMTYGVLTFLRNFDLYVPSKLERDYKKISIPEKTKENITLPTTGSEFGSTITWKSLDTSLIDDKGNVTRPDGRRDKYCVLQATLTNSSGTLVKEFGVTVEGTGRDNSEESGSGSSTGIVASGGGGGGGGGATVKPPVPVEVKPPVDESAPTNNTFADVPEEHWAYESIAELTEKGIVNGMGENSFKPEGTVTREQYLSMLVRAFGFTDEKASAEFTDVEKGSWYFDAVSVAQSLGICGGYEDGSFGIGKEITREEMAVMAYRSALLAELGVEATDENTAWKDSGEISYFAYEAVAALNNAGIIKGISEDKFSPKTTTTRAQAAVIIQRLLSVQ